LRDSRLSLPDRGVLAKIVPAPFLRALPKICDYCISLILYQVLWVIRVNKTSEFFLKNKIARFTVKDMDLNNKIFSFYVTEDIVSLPLYVFVPVHLR